MSNVQQGGEAYEELDELYDVWCAEVVEDLPFYLSLASALAREMGRETLDIVELGAGSGRVTVPLAAAGHRVTAIDASPAQLDRLRERASADADAAVSPIGTIHADMRTLDTLLPAASADLVLIPFRGMLHVTPDRAALLAAIHALLRPGGVVAFDVFHPTGEQVGATHGQWLDRRDAATTRGRWRFQERASYRPELAAEPGGLKLEVDVRCRWSARRRPTREVSPLPDPAPGAATERATLLELQLVPAERWASALSDAGFVIDGSYGWFDGRPLAADDDDSIWVARRA
ncbi:MAG: class I SAM-dependent methyltransferase [Gaiellales bacterium]